MNPSVEFDSFTIHFNDKGYECKPIDQNDRMVYRINFNGSYLYLTQAMSRDRHMFWTSIPKDDKLHHIVPLLGSEIEKHFS